MPPRLTSKNSNLRLSNIAILKWTWTILGSFSFVTGSKYKVRVYSGLFLRALITHNFEYYLNGNGKNYYCILGYKKINCRNKSGMQICEKSIFFLFSIYLLLFVYFSWFWIILQILLRLKIISKNNFFA